MIISRSSDYALRALMYLSEQGSDKPIPLDQIAKAKRVPPALLSKILQTLVRAKVLRSQKGYGGGFVLAVDSNTLDLAKIIELIDGPFTVFECLSDSDFCESTQCKLRGYFMELQTAMVGMLAKTTVHDLTTDTHPASAN
jgi:Rrf2 family cysteine metabolism transcriptional repressor